MWGHLIVATGEAGDGRAPWWGGWWVGDLFVVNQGLRVFDPHAYLFISLCVMIIGMSLIFYPALSRAFFRLAVFKQILNIV